MGSRVLDLLEVQLHIPTMLLCSIVLVLLSITSFSYATQALAQNLTLSEPAIYLCAISKKEDLYIEEWVNYNLLIGFEQIHIYDNNDYDTEEQDSSLGKVTRSLPSKYSGKVFVYSFPGHKPTPLKSAYIDFLAKHQNQDVYTAFFDIDEFLVMNNHFCIRSFLREYAFPERRSIAISWYIFGSNNLKYYENRPVLQRFTMRMDTGNRYIKNILYLPDIVDFYGAHNIRLHPPKVRYDIYGNTILNTFAVNCNITEVRLHHYMIKSTSEYHAKMKRGESAPTVRNMTLFYKINEESIIYDNSAWKIQQFQNKNICGVL